ncbi:Uma2 family endonuclease [candidate division KSB1 bacterium]|nr:Uma2 family endonuclease [candidate division KSB1 bacterium]NIR73342.1 Uma2 family endonuclease [candidate division KSB1 bacterium]NIS27048.1 Uma2 family endonuclease [candidate division KSB1 bacterium]NIT73888.1 Uma2 family endonuclease [candidate division KSB1 bacterium]NIU27793.1 Uma2 family endonuclease [candidate division KSB1 bacterium]
MHTLAKEKTTEHSRPKFMTEEEFLDFCDEDIKAEFVDGEVIVHSPSSSKHNRIAVFVTTLVQLYVDQKKLGTVWGENFQVRLRPGLRRVPDLIFVSRDNEVEITNTEIEGAPDLVMEIVSPDSVDRDWRDKFLEYEKVQIKEYWVVDPNNKRFEIYGLNDKGQYEAQVAEGGVVKSNVLSGFWLKKEWLWQDPLPNVVEIAKELNIKI